MNEPFSRLEKAISGLDTPIAVIDGPALQANADDLVRRAGGVPVRVASKSVRVRGILEAALDRDGFASVMSYSLAESTWLADVGFDDILLAYPTTNRAALHHLGTDDKRRAAITLMVDSTASLDFIDSVLGANHPPLRVCIDVDSSLRIGPVHLGVRRSPVHTAQEAGKLAAAIVQRNGFDLVGVMFYDAQIAGLPDSSRAVRLIKSRSATELLERRSKVVDAISTHAHLEIVNAGGTGSLELIGTEGSGEVQTPVKGKAARSLSIGDLVWMRHAKAGEMCERFDAVHLVGADGSLTTMPTYRGEGKNFR